MVCRCYDNIVFVDLYDRIAANRVLIDYLSIAGFFIQSDRRTKLEGFSGRGHPDGFRFLCTLPDHVTG